MTNPKHTSSDLVERLRRTVYRNSYYKDDTRVPVNPDGPEAADRIEALEAENERLRGSLFDAGRAKSLAIVWHIARAALEARHD